MNVASRRKIKDQDSISLIKICAGGGGANPLS